MSIFGDIGSGLGGFVGGLIGGSESSPYFEQAGGINRDIYEQWKNLQGPELDKALALRQYSAGPRYQSQNVAASTMGGGAQTGANLGNYAQQLASISAMKDMAKSGYDASTMAQMRQAQQQGAAGAQAARAQALQAQQQRGGSVSGGDVLAASLAGGQGAMQSASQLGQNAAIQAAGNRMAALGQVQGAQAGITSQQQALDQANAALRQQAMLTNSQYAQQAAMANQAAQNQANMYNTIAQAQAANQNVSSYNQELQRQMNAKQTMYGNKLAQMQGMGGAGQNWANYNIGRGSGIAQADAQMGQGLGGALGTLASFALLNEGGMVEQNGQVLNPHHHHPAQLGKEGANFTSNPSVINNYAHGGKVKSCSCGSYAHGGECSCDKNDKIHNYFDGTSSAGGFNMPTFDPAAYFAAQQNAAINTPFSLGVNPDISNSVGATPASFADKIKAGNKTEQESEKDNKSKKSSGMDASLMRGFIPTGNMVGFGQPSYAHGGWTEKYKEGGVVDGKAKLPGDHIENDTVKAMLSPGEIVVPRSMVEDPEKAAKFVKETIYHKMAEQHGPVFKHLHDRLSKIENKSKK